MAGRPENARAFSLLELLTVIALLAILTALVVPAVRGISSATELSVSASAVVDALNLARQTALSANRPVEVRFFEVPRSSDPALAYRAIGLYAIGEAGPVPIGKLSFLRNNVVMSDTEAFGTLLRGLPVREAALPAIDASAGKTFKYHYFTFRPDGSASLPRLASVGGGDAWHVMLYDDRQPPAGQTPPPNYITIQLLPESGRTRTFQPGAN